MPGRANNRGNAVVAEVLGAVDIVDCTQVVLDGGGEGRESGGGGDSGD